MMKAPLISLIELEDSWKKANHVLVVGEEEIFTRFDDESTFDLFDRARR